MDVTSLPLLRAGPDVLRVGWQRADQDARPVHEVQRLEMHRRVHGFEAKMNSVEQIYGKAAAMRLRTEKIMLEQHVRLPGLPSSRVGLDTLMGNDDTLDFADILNEPQENPEVHFRVHDAMEVKLAIF
ncbi:hypothetical protein SPRG_18875 [Saprolegnia parasitica CBS 223.65]|uniref:Proteasome maturation protein n=1 Tax=Saprolegnia parasitica (strain CBS 223.65) TaxID=695850 RepID=A0A067CYH8_SAPPC|nr:hypothetical protein SPRG_18875 [Saprolegnia parasitica CBS 223.65]KDO35729.1 hypothetical protein SPRG_18875 [Saprolegnia parasitica CBS 223.65]|eukprot:XP_012194089.1 hypothetical protein SPRG_18875 [Saprolegnia parasitica CBS 223.65]